MLRLTYKKEEVPMFWWDGTYVFVILGLIICSFATMNVQRVYARYKRVGNHRGMTAVEMAERLLSQAGLYNVSIEVTDGEMTDHYDPRSRVVRLSRGTYQSNSVAALGIAAHECGHAIQHNLGYAPLTLRNMILPVVNISSVMYWPIFILGLIFSFTPLIQAGIIVFLFVLLFQVITLPVELNASKRALRYLGDTNTLDRIELKGAKKVLRAAAMTYIAAVAASALQLLRLVVLSNRRD